MFAYLAHQVLKRIDPEKAHNIARKAMIKRRCAPGVYFDRLYGLNTSKAVLLGVTINNQLGLSAGFDKNAELVDVAEDYGFGFIEVGSVTFLGGDGNPKPRLFRVHDRDVMNRMGLNGIAAHHVAERLSKVHSKAYGVNIAKTHSPDIMGDNAIRDVVGSYELLKDYGIYTVLNISCPNTKEGRTFEDPTCLKELLSAVINTKGSRKPLLVKLSPVASKVEEIVQICRDNHVTGYVISNTIPFEHPKFGKGGLSGDRVKPLSQELIKKVRILDNTATIIGVGGIFTGQDIREYLNLGVQAVEVYNGFVRGPNAGPDFAKRVLSECFKR